GGTLGRCLQTETLTHIRADILAQQALLRHPDFVVARMKGQYWQVREKVFDYEGRFRLAHELRG
ncbi:hypothetical protein ACUODJ_55465, partial [Escherichia sp. HC-CC]